MMRTIASSSAPAATPLRPPQGRRSSRKSGSSGVVRFGATTYKGGEPQHGQNLIMAKGKYYRAHTTSRLCSFLGQLLLVCLALTTVLFCLNSWFVRWRSGAMVGSPTPHNPNKEARTTPPDGGIDACGFRPYPPHRYYHLGDKSPPAFLSQAEYIYGEWPTVIRTADDSPPRKICVDQSSWRKLSPGRSTHRYWPFADGTNPSLLTLKRVASMKDLTPETTEWLESLHQPGQSIVKKMTKNPPPRGTVYLATACMTHSQCNWGTPVPPTFGNETEPAVVLTTLLLLDENFQTLHQATIVLRRDAPWGKQFPSMPLPQRNPDDSKESLPTHTPALDDARLFVHAGQVWVSYREGRGFGYETQVLNPLHVRFDSQRGLLEASILASETASFCCGRNMALMESLHNASALLSLTWVDPVTVVTVDTTPHILQKKRQEAHQRDPRQSRRLQKSIIGGSGAKQKKSHVHGTNAFMVHLPDRGAFLGVAHFHRPHDRRPNPYARFGHHYTHALYTVSDSPPYRLTSLSAEFVLPRAVAGPDRNNAADDADAEIIQFSSGLEVVEEEDRILISYGINDCEAAIVTVSLEYALQTLLRPVEAGTQVVDFMEPLSME